MKIGPDIEGTPEEIRDFCENTGLNATDFFTLPHKLIKPIWFVFPVVLLLSAFFWLTLYKPASNDVVNLIFILGCSSALWLAVVVQLRFKYLSASVLTLIGFLVLLLYALGVIPPDAVLQEVKSLTK